MNALDRLVEETSSGGVASFTTNRLPLATTDQSSKRRRPSKKALVDEVQKRFANGYSPA